MEAAPTRPSKPSFCELRTVSIIGRLVCVWGDCPLPRSGNRTPDSDRSQLKRLKWLHRPQRNGGPAGAVPCTLPTVTKVPPTPGSAERGIRLRSGRTSLSAAVLGWGREHDHRAHLGSAPCGRRGSPPGTADARGTALLAGIVPSAEARWASQARGAGFQETAVSAESVSRASLPCPHSVTG